MSCGACLPGPIRTTTAMPLLFPVRNILLPFYVHYSFEKEVHSDHILVNNDIKLIIERTVVDVIIK